jgi:addiction module RelE/StbE family toxin
MHLEWSVFARADRRTNFDRIEADNPRAAVAIDERIRTRVEGLARFPEMGRLGRIEGTRELVISGTPYIAAYRIADDTVRILRVLHGAQQWPDEMPVKPPPQSLTE